ncbi:MAG: type VII secretion protein EccB [Phycicoccus sp.]
MWSRRDQIQAYQFVRRRTMSAVLLGDANHAVSPVKRSVSGLITGIVVLVLVIGGFAIYGVLRPGGSSAWKASGKVVLEKESGARFVRAEDGALHPVLNYASARLIVGGKGDITQVSRNSLAGVARGPMLGIPGAPDALPAPDRLSAQPWTACSSRRSDAGPGEPATLNLLLAPPTRTTPIAFGRGAAAVVQAGETVYVLTDGRRFRVRSAQPDSLLRGLGLGTAPRLIVDPRWLATVPAGPDLNYLVITRRGEVSTALPGVDARVGQVFAQRLAGSAGQQFYVLLIDGLAPISTIQARLILADPQTATAYGAEPVGERSLPAAAVAAGKPSLTDLGRTQYPVTAPDALTFTAGAEVVLCSQPSGFRDGVPAVTISLSFAVPVAAGSRASVVPVDPAGPAPARVYVPAGSGALVKTVSAANVTTGALYLVTDEGRRYSIPDDASRDALGLRRVRPVELPATFVDLVPAGPALDRTAAAENPAAAALGR